MPLQWILQALKSKQLLHQIYVKSFHLTTYIFLRFNNIQDIDQTIFIFPVIVHLFLLLYVEFCFMYKFLKVKLDYRFLFPVFSLHSKLVPEQIKSCMQLH